MSSQTKRRLSGDRTPSPQNSGKRQHTTTTKTSSKPPPAFPSYLDAGHDLPPKIRILCEILAKTPPSGALEPELDDVGVRVSSSDVETVLKLSYSHPGAAVAFFRWAGAQHLADRHSPYSWNLVVDLLGKNRLFDAMWGAVKSMRSEGLLSLATYASIFSSLASAGRADDAFSAFEKMNLHGVARDTAALNSLLSALCREGCVDEARAVYTRVCPTGNVIPDADTFAILLEGCENERDYKSARDVFDGMIGTIGWDPENVPAYESYLSTLFRSGGGHGVSEVLRLLEKMKGNRCYPGMRFFRTALEVLTEGKDVDGASRIWEMVMAQDRCFPDTTMFNLMIELQCHRNHTDLAIRLLDEMVVYGAFPDSRSYNALLQGLLKAKKIREAVSIFNEMAKNECEPTEANCLTLLRHLLDSGVWDMALKIWKCMVANRFPPLEEGGNLLVVALRDLDKLPEACKYAEDMIDRGIKLNSSTLSKLRQSLQRVGKAAIHDNLLRKWKSH